KLRIGFTKKLFRYGVDLRANVGYGFWQMAIGVKKELTYATLWQAIENDGRLLKPMVADHLGLVKTNCC
ncbi:MAG: Mu-like prophage major head subunit gpT family protein, partial [Rheinheimera sp.]|nr:Mu-like prophage major head subunit gpT family protein [Rheinheimera sp.]